MKTYRQKPVIKLTIRGVGRLWMPAAMVHTKGLVEKFSFDEHKAFHGHWTGLRDAILSMTNAGDYRSGIHLTDAVLIVSQEILYTQDDGQIIRTENREYCKYLSPDMKQINDCWATEEQIAEADDNSEEYAA